MRGAAYTSTHATSPSPTALSVRLTSKDIIPPLPPLDGGTEAGQRPIRRPNYQQTRDTSGFPNSKSCAVYSININEKLIIREKKNILKTLVVNIVLTDFGFKLWRKNNQIQEIDKQSPPNNAFKY